MRLDAVGIPHVYVWGGCQAAQRKKLAEFAEKYPTPAERLKACLTESDFTLPAEVSVDDGRKVLVGILERRKLIGNKELVAA